MLMADAPDRKSLISAIEDVFFIEPAVEPAMEPEAKAAYEAWRSFGEPSMARLSRLLNISVVQLRRWAATYDWKARVESGEDGNAITFQDSIAALAAMRMPLLQEAFRIAMDPDGDPRARVSIITNLLGTAGMSADIVKAMLTGEIQAPVDDDVQLREPEDVLKALRAQIHRSS